MSITLTPDQQTAMDAFGAFIMDPIETVFLLTGYSGTGKTTLVKTLLENMDSFMKAARLVIPSTPDYEIALTATTNKAAESFSHLTAREVVTIHSFLGLRVNTDYRTNVTTLTPKSMTPKEGYLLFIDEASYVDRQLLDLIFKLTLLLTMNGVLIQQWRIKKGQNKILHSLGKPIKI